MTTPTTVQVRLQIRADTAANWTSVNPVLLANELGLESDTKKFKIGNGTNNWGGLAYFPSIVSGGTVLGNLEIGTTGTLTFEGSTADGFETTLGVVDPTADRTILLPNQSGTVIVGGNASITNADIAANAEIAVSKLADGTARQLLQTDAAGTGVEWTDNVDIPGTLDVTGAATFDSSVTITGDLTVNGTTTNINTQNLVVEDKNVILGDVATPTDVTADGGGITLKGATDKTINWVDATDAWTSSERFSVPLGSASAPSLTFTGDPNTGIYSPGADQLALATGGTGRLFVDASGRIYANNSAAIGPGTSTPTRTLQLSDTTGQPAIKLTNNTSGHLSTDGADITFSGTNLFITNREAGAIIAEANGSERLRITSAGLVGIGTSSPSCTLQVNGSSTVSSQANVAAQIGPNVTSDVLIGSINGNTPFIASQGAYSLQLRTNNASALTIDSSQRVGIGTGSPSYAFDVNGQARVAGDFHLSGGSVFDALSQDVFIQGNSGYGIIFRTNGANERARIDSSGRFLVGTSSARTTLFTSATAPFQVEGTGFNNSTISVLGAGSNSYDAGALVVARNGGNAVSGNTIVAATNRLGIISFQGNDGAKFVSSSEIESIVEGTPALGKVGSRLTFSTTADAASSPTEQWRISNGGTVLYNQPAPAAVDTTATLTVANLTTKIITSSTAAAVTMTLPTGTLMDGGFSGLYTNMCFEWSVINTGGTNAVTVQAGSGHTLVGSGTVAANNSVRFASRRTGANTWVTYRVG